MKLSYKASKKSNINFFIYHEEIRNQPKELNQNINRSLTHIPN